MPELTYVLRRLLRPFGLALYADLQLEWARVEHCKRMLDAMDTRIAELQSEAAPRPAEYV